MPIDFDVPKPQDNLATGATTLVDEAAEERRHQNIADFLQREKEEKEAIKQAIPINKDAIFNALAAANIAVVNVEFDGSGDQGQIEDITAFTDDKAMVELPSVMVERLYPDDGMVRPVEVDGKMEMRRQDGSTHQTELNDAIECVCYDHLEAEHPGWEINDGSYGEFILDVAKRTITLGFNERYSDSTYTEDEF